MTVTTFMTGKTPVANYAGQTLAADWVLAIDSTSAQTAIVTDYVVLRNHIENIDGTIETNSATTDYIGEGSVDTVLSKKRSFAVGGNRLFGDDAQDFLFAFTMLYATGAAANVKYTYFNFLTGTGETGVLAVAPDQDAGGTAPDKATIGLTLSQVGVPTAYTWAAP